MVSLCVRVRLAGGAARSTNHYSGERDPSRGERRAGSRSAEHYRGTIHELKIKVAEKGQTLDDDITRVAAARRALPNARLKVDANAGWSVPEAIEALAALNEYDLLYAEQPVATVEELAQVRALVREHGLSMLIAADESVRKASDPLKVAQAHAADVLIVKAAPLGGARRALKIVEQAGLPAVVSSALESSVGIATGVSLAAALPNLPYACGLSTVSLMSADVTENSLLARDGEFQMRQVAPTESALRRVETESEVRDAWVERIRRCYLVLQEALPHESLARYVLNVLVSVLGANCPFRDPIFFTRPNTGLE